MPPGDGSQSEAVVPYIGTWIETIVYEGGEVGRKVVPYIGTWIETPLSGQQ